MAPVNSSTRTLMLEATETILREEGYAALTSRRVADRLGAKQQLVFYYFRTMDELVVEAFRRLAKRELERLEAALAADRPVHELWDACIHKGDARLIAEFTALAHRNEDLRKEVVELIERLREVHVEAITRASREADGGLAGLPAVALSFLASSAALALIRESAIGVSMGHAEVVALIRQAVAALEPGGADAPTS
jgi:AcrR family transcriptional regulator